MAFFVAGDPSPTVRTSRFLPSFLLGALCLATVAVYLPGLRGGFLLDDFYNLHLLERIPADGYAQYLFSSRAGPGGRPLSLLSFALQHESWPYDPLDFKMINLVLHLVCGGLVFVIARRLGVLQNAAMPAAAAALLAAGLWLLHPMQQSTVLYVVQRMTQISALFTLAGLFGFLVGRDLCSRGRGQAGYVLMTVSILGGTLLAALGKENGILLPLLALVMDRTLLRSAPEPAGYAKWRAWVLVVPAVLPVLYLGWKMPDAARSFSDLPYTMWQKTITESVVLVQYLLRLIVPSPGAFGLYHDDFAVSHGLLVPPWTLAATVCVSGLLAAGVAGRRRYPMASFGILWFFAGHVLESTHLNLQFYFEHRNYVPSVGIFLALAWYLTGLCAGGMRRSWWRVATVAWALLVVGVTVQNTVLWGDRLMQAREGVRTHPRSIWAREDLGRQYLAAGRTEAALSVYAEMEREFPGVPSPRLKQMAIMGCVRNVPMPAAWWQQTQELAPRAEGGGSAVLAELDTVLWTLQTGECTGVDTAELRDWIEALARNGAYGKEKGALLELAAGLCLHRGEWERALVNLAGAVQASPTANRQVQLAELQLAMGRIAEARVTLERLDTGIRRRPFERFGYADRIEALRRALHGAEASRDELETGQWEQNRAS